MALFGPTGYSFELDAWNPSTNVVGSAEALPGITEFSGIKPEAVVSEGTRLGDAIESEIPTGTQRLEDITVKGFFDDAASGAFRRIGRPAKRADANPRTLKVTHKTGVTQSVEVFVKRNDPITSVGEVTMFEAVFGIAARQASEFTEAGF